MLMIYLKKKLLQDYAITIQTLLMKLLKIKISDYLMYPF